MMLTQSKWCSTEQILNKCSLVKSMWGVCRSVEAVVMETNIVRLQSSCESFIWWDGICVPSTKCLHVTNFLLFFFCCDGRHQKDGKQPTNSYDRGGVRVNFFYCYSEVSLLADTRPKILLFIIRLRGKLWYAYLYIKQNKCGKKTQMPRAADLWKVL